MDRPIVVTLGRWARRPPTGERGSTLVEVMVALVVFVIGAFAVAAFLLLSLQAQGGAGRRGQADQLLQAKVEDLLALPYTEVADGSDVRTLEGMAFERGWTVTEDVPVARSKTVRVDVSWQERGREFAVHAATLRGAE